VTDDVVRLFLDEPSAGYSAGWSRFLIPDLFTGVPIDLGGPQYTRQDQAFCEAVRNRTSVESDAVNALRVQRIVDAVYASAAAGGEARTV